MKHFAFLIAAMTLIGSCSSGPDELTLLVGTYTTGNSYGIYSCKFSLQTGELVLLDSTAADNPSFLTVAAGKSTVYAVHESGPASAVSAYAPGGENGGLQRLWRIENPGSDPCHVAADPAGAYVVTADYSSGTVTFYGMEGNGIVQQYAFTGSGPDERRQRSSHVHCVVFSPDGEHLFATDLGADRIYVFNKDSADIPLLKDTVDLESGSGPRHLVFNNSGNRAYLINELSGMVSVFEHDKGKLKQIQSIEADTCKARGSAHIALSGDGRFLYVSTRLQGDGLVIFSVDPAYGMLTKAGYQPTGSHPRHFLITPDDHWVLVACKNENHIEIYSRDVTSGLLRDTGKRMRLEQPVCIGAL
ncbi:MAG TPA: lactonase family protein [Bacteroidales bacterium]|jgi:6-phosphogluconolactonase (cycloisomerase 2 family)|nr:lactonase family protein [Bacteroidales bacterium]OQC56028.1 MAG: 6-phosphogluconolactonase [Bacteroidetes bacterium ADurb.Bin013]MBV6455629.1 6-phosphogluconolactonase [Bacteroidales bacterium]MCZ2315908.1 lactonase family protein [Bacteroidales bacterium]NLZ08367.1 lactonase family protein [Bacteroidales bacterium]